MYAVSLEAAAQCLGMRMKTCRPKEPATQTTNMQVGRESPAELKAAKLARGRARGLEDRGLKPNTAEREAIEAVIKAPPNRCTPRGRQR